jgi:hypothetical protein
MLLDLVRQARRRLISNDLLSQGANASSAALAALILVLLLGAQVLNWYWAALIPLAAMAVGVYLVWRRRPGEYAAAQVIDRRLDLADTLSTALYFDQEGARARVPESVRQHQYEQASRLCPQVDVRIAVPYRAPRALYASLALLLVAGSLFALRYGLSHSLDLRPPLASIIHRSLGGPDPVERAAAKKDAPRIPDMLDQMGMSVGDRETVDKQEPIPATAPGAEAMANPDDTRTTSKLENGDQISTGEPGDESEEGGVGGDKAGEGQNGAGEAKDGQPSSKPQKGSGDKNNLLDKFKEAMQNLLAKMKIQPPPSGQQSSQMAQNKQGKSQQAGGKQSGGQSQKRDGAQQDGAQEGEAGEEAQNQQHSQSKGAGQNAEQQANKQPGSGVGKQDGDKDVKLAEQMAAMGKLSEIIGKRSANVSGEAMVEVKNTSQSLATRYESRRAAHGESGAEINRDEVPVALQGYVQQYFEQVRKGEQKPAGK